MEERNPYPLGAPIKKETAEVPEWAPIPGKRGFWINRKNEIAYGPERPAPTPKAEP